MSHVGEAYDRHRRTATTKPTSLGFELMDYQLIAATWRKEQAESLAMTGVVLIWHGEVYGWKNCLRDATHERPNAIAVDEQGRVFRAEGGNDNDGAKCWVVTSPD